MTPLPPARAAALRGDDYQHIIGLHCALEVITNDDLESVSIEDADGGAFDDIVVRPKSGLLLPTRYIQVKAGVYNNVVIDHDWLTKQATEKGKSPLQHFHDTWSTRETEGAPFVLEMYSNKNYDHNDPVLQLIDQSTRTIPVEKLRRLTQRSRGGVQLTAWAQHLSIGGEELGEFLRAVRFVHGEEDQSWIDRCSALMRLTGFRGDHAAIVVAHAMVRGWVKRGDGIRSAEQIAAELHELGLAAEDDELLLVVHGIDTVTTSRQPSAAIDIMDLYEGNDAFARRALRDPADWDAQVLPALEAARTELREFDSRRVELAAAMRLPMYFAVGRTFSQVGNWILTTTQRGVTWSTDTPTVDAALEVPSDLALSEVPDLAVVVELTLDATADVADYVDRSQISVGRLVTLSLPGGPGQESVSGPAWARSWTRKAREEVRRIVRETRATHIHLFLAAPAGVALLLGHDWNLLPTTTVYEHHPPSGYEPTMTLEG